MIVQPANHMFDHAYVTSVLEAHPGKFVGCLLADPTSGGGGAAAIEQLAQQHGYRAVRFNPYLWPEGQKMTNQVRGVTG
jgi:predicted TIM-barrel fold metal-dependent hydrolase